MIDKYEWMRDLNWPDVKDKRILAHLKHENDLFEQVMLPTKELQEQIYQELEGRVTQEDESYPIKIDDYYYYSKLVKHKDYPIFYRKFMQTQELLLDANTLSIGKSSFAMGALKVDDAHSKMAYSYDAEGSERYNIYIKDLESKLDLSDVITNSISDIIWNKAGDGFYYLALNDSWRSDKVFLHKLGSKQEDDILIYQELDPGFHISISQSSSDEYLLIETGNAGSSEVWYLSRDGSELKLAVARAPDRLYSLDHMYDKFYLLINDHGRNFRLVSIKTEANFASDQFQEIVAHNTQEYLTSINIYQQYLVLSKKVNGLNKIEYYDLKNQELAGKIDFAEEIYEADVYYTNHQDQYIRVIYSSLTQPKSVLEYSFDKQLLYTRKVDKIPGGYDANLYTSKRLWVKSSDDALVPVSIVYRTDLAEEPVNLLLCGYGSYGIGMPLSFRANIISLLDRGFIYAIAHIRGGDELGYDWYESAKFLTKHRSFEDFIAVAEYLIAKQYTSSEKLAIMGGSAGGTLMGAMANQRPELFKAIVALVPFVDVLNTMLDADLPLTPGEFEEWGNPIINQEYYDYIKTYSPYDNVTAQHYPDILVTAGLNDPRVGYWEAAKWVAKLKEFKLDNRLLIFKTEMETGHKGQSGRFKSLREVAMIYSFIIMSLQAS